MWDMIKNIGQKNNKCFFQYRYLFFNYIIEDLCYKLYNLDSVLKRKPLAASEKIFLRVRQQEVAAYRIKKFLLIQDIWSNISRYDSSVLFFLIRLYASR